MRIFLIRHGQTQGNRERRYLGRTDQPLTPEGQAGLAALALPPVEAVYTSPLLRCRQSAQILYPSTPPIVLDDLRECDFGAFEGKNYEELKESPTYQAWLASCGSLPFPDGEDHRDFVLRCGEAFVAGAAQSLGLGHEAVAFVIHGGTIMSILSLFSPDEGDFYHWQVPNAGGFVLELSEDLWAAKQKLTSVQSLESLL